MALDKRFLKPYNPKETEERIYKIWEESGFFNPDVCVKEKVCSADSEPFSIVLPPPNVTGVLHLGHALEDSLQDSIVRYNRMAGRKTLWVPGTDHAAIATQSRVEVELHKKEKKTKHDLGREEFVKRVEKFAQESHDTIIEQLKRVGVSLDWSREAYTLDKEREMAVNTAFKKMYDSKLIYQGERVINWDPKLQTTVSDDEVERVQKTTPFYYFKYGPFEIATARPETKFGDKYVVVHPEDQRYSEYKHGQKIDLEWINGPITATVIKDDVIDMEFGTGAMTITPAHDSTDFEIAKRHNLEFEQIIDFNGKLLSVAGEFEGLHINKARPLIVEKLQKKGLVTKVEENYSHAAAVNSRGGGTIEPQIMKQWFVNVDKEFEMKDSKIEGIKTGQKITLKQLMKHVVESGQIKILPDRFKKVYYNWIENLHDWNISRQIWFGHQIPVWKKGGETYVGVESPKGDGWERDSDTLDTWFSSGLWTFSTLGWPNKTEDLKTYHPTTLINPGYEILFFWVARMILMSGFLLGEIPFKTVYLHGMLRDKQGRKFSKSLGTGVDPIEVIEKHGADALRMSLIVGIGPGNDSAFDEQKVLAYKKFSNKIWNASRFVLSNTEDLNLDNKPELNEIESKWIEELQKLQKDITEDMENYRLYLASEKLYHYFWHTFADIIIEEEKSKLLDGNDREKQQAGWTLNYILETTLKMLHPFMPFVTEEIWQASGHENLLMVESWPH